MSKKTITVEIPEGYDDVELVDGKLVFKKESAVNSWRNSSGRISGYYVDRNSALCSIADVENCELNSNVFATRRQAKSMIAMAQLSQIIANDKRFGGSVSDEAWSTSSTKFVIIRALSRLEVVAQPGSAYFFLAFHTKEQATRFLEENRDLIETYYMLT